MTEKTPLRGRHQFGKYRLIAHVATGGMAELFLASQASLAGFEKLIVIKRILPHLAREKRFVDMFLDEARIAAMLSHPNVVHIFDVGKIDGQYYIAMEYLAGESLAMVVQTCRRHNHRVPFVLSAGITMQAAEGLHHAHTSLGPDGKPLSIVHRDVSPQNIFVLYNGGVKVVDFGIAKAAMCSSQTQTGTLKGKFCYMSPEQILGQNLDSRSDVYALGIVLWECLTGRKLYRQESDLGLLQAIAHHDAPSPATVDPNIPAPLVQITLKALARERELRHQTAAELRAELAAYLRSVSAEADTAAISRMMRHYFMDRIKKKQSVIESAQSSAEQGLSDNLFDGIGNYLSDTELSISRSTPGLRRSGTSSVVKRKGWRQFAGVGLFAALLATIGLIGGYYLFREKGNRPTPKAGPARRAGAVASAAQPVRAVGTPERASPEATVIRPDISADEVPASTKAPDKHQPKKRIKRARRIAKAREGRPAGEAKAGIAEPKLAATKPGRPLEPGKLRLITVPWTDIYYQGKRLGQTPLVDVKLPAGAVQLRVVNEQEKIDRVITIQIPSGERVVKRFNFY